MQTCNFHGYDFVKQLHGFSLLELWRDSRKGIDPSTYPGIKLLCVFVLVGDWSLNQLVRFCTIFLCSLVIGRNNHESFLKIHTQAGLTHFHATWVQWIDLGCAFKLWSERVIDLFSGYRLRADGLSYSHALLPLLFKVVSPYKDVISPKFGEP